MFKRLKSIYILFSSAFIFAFQPQTTEELQTAVDMWVDDNVTALSIYGEINTWDVSLITSMVNLFQNKTTFNDDISSWNVSNVTTMNGMFESYTTSEFNQNLSNWNVSNVETMSNMFSGAINFNGDISNWDVSNVWTMAGMFSGAINFNGDISNWDVSSLELMNWMFGATMGYGDGATSFNQDISNWNISNVYQMNYLFNKASNFNQNISGWNISSVETMVEMFDDADALSEENQCAIHTSFSLNDAWTYDWSEFCGEDDLSNYSTAPIDYDLFVVYPNPFNPSANIAYEVKEFHNISIDIYNMNGQLIESLYEGFKNPGEYSINWNASNFTSGAYLIKLESGPFVETQKVMLVK